MRALIITKQGTPVADNVEFVDDWPEPVPGPGEVRVRTEATALNHLDLWTGRGLPGVDRPFPRISGSDGAGTVDAVGPGADEAWIGRRVVLNAARPVPVTIAPDVKPALPDTSMIGEHDHGTHASAFTVPAANVLDIGDRPATEAAAYALSHLTAYRMLYTRAGIAASRWVLITGIGGGTALAALGLARHAGARTIVTSRHQWKLDRALELGADHAVLDEGADFSRAVRAVTGRRGVDIAVDSVGKAVHLACVKSLARGGVLVTCGCTTGADAVTDLARVFWNQLTIVGSTMGNMEEFRRSTALFRSGQVTPVIDGVHDAERGAEAYARLESGEQFGKVVIRWAGPAD